MGKIIGKNISKGLNGKYSQKLLDHAEQSATDALRKVIQKTTEANKIANKTTKVQNRIIKKQLQIKMIKKYLKKNIYLQKKDRKLLMI